MAGKAEVIVGVINDGVTVASGATAISDQFVTNNQGMVLVSQTAQTGAVIASVTSVTKLAGPYVPIINMPANIVAGTITFLKLGIDVRDGRKIDQGDVYSLIGNVAGIIGTVAFLAGGGVWLVGGAAIVSVGAGLLSIHRSNTFNQIVTAAENFFRNNPSDNYLDYLCAPDMKIVDRNTIRMAYANTMLSCHWISDTDELLPFPLIVSDIGAGAGAGAGGGGTAFGGAPASSGPVVTPPPHDVANVGISIIVGGNTYDAGDQYGCCTGTSDGYM